MVLSCYYVLLQSFNIICECYNNYFILKSSISIERKYNCCILSQHLSENIDIRTKELCTFLSNIQTFSDSLSCAQNHNYINMSTWISIRQTLPTLPPSRTFPLLLTLHSSSKSNAYLVFFEKPIWLVSGIKKYYVENRTILQIIWHTISGFLCK